MPFFFEQQAFITQDLHTLTADSSGYSWRCVNNCHFIIILIGETYGELTNTGVSQMHISYLNAKTKDKPMVVLATDKPNRSAKLQDFLTLLDNQKANVHTVNDRADNTLLFTDIYQTLAENTTPIKTALMDKEGYIKKHPLPALSAMKKHIANQSDIVFLKPSDALIPVSSSKAIVPPSTAKQAYEPATALTTPSLKDQVLLNCTAHAFEGGTLIEVGFVAATTWQAIVAAIVKTGMAFSVQGLWNILNDIITPQAMPIVRLKHPDIHAISRCQVTKKDVVWVQEELLSAKWIIKSQSTVGAKDAWRPTDTAKNLLSSYSA